MDKQMIEEMVKAMENWAYRNGMLWHEGHAKSLAEALVENGYEKIPEGAVLKEKALEKLVSALRSNVEAYKEQVEVLKEFNNVSCKVVRKETAEKFAERLKAKLTDIIPFEDYEVADWNYDGMDIENSIDEICKEFTEGKNEQSNE